MSLRSTLLSCFTAITCVAALLAYSHQYLQYSIVGNENGVFVLDRNTKILHHCDKDNCKMITPQGVSIEMMRQLSGIPNAKDVLNQPQQVCGKCTTDVAKPKMEVTSFQNLTQDPKNLTPTDAAKKLATDAKDLNMPVVAKPVSAVNPFPADTASSSGSSSSSAQPSASPTPPPTSAPATPPASDPYGSGSSGSTSSPSASSSNSYGASSSMSTAQPVSAPATPPGSDPYGSGSSGSTSSPSTSSSDSYGSSSSTPSAQPVSAPATPPGSDPYGSASSPSTSSSDSYGSSSSTPSAQPVSAPATPPAPDPYGSGPSAASTSQGI